APATRVLIAIGARVGGAGPWLLVLLLAAALAFRRALAAPGFRLKADRLLLSVPVAGRLVREVLAARLTRTLGTLLANGVPLISALSIAGETLGNLAGTAAVEAAALGAKSRRRPPSPL